ncbi:tetratricopeptide repeat protein [Roseiarcus sp.]|uniref:tetratricopeptide repeat protein n=1 Tax=Roseiarcus sp. TaxID=1969460 RepID=UPI003F94CC16
MDSDIAGRIVVIVVLGQFGRWVADVDETIRNLSVEILLQPSKRRSVGRHNRAEARGQSLMATGKYEAAIEDFNAALNVSSDNSDAWAGLGFCYQKLNNRSKAVESYQRAVSANPNNTNARSALQRMS